MKKRLYTFIIGALCCCGLFVLPICTQGGNIFSLLLSSRHRDTMQDKLDTRSIIKSMLILRNPHTGLSPSHLGHPGYDDLAFLYDKAVDAIIFNAAGHQREAEKILDYLAARLRIPIQQVYAWADTNGVYGIVKLFRPRGSSQRATKGLMNALDVTSVKSQGAGLLEFWTTPGPLSFVIYAMLAVNPKKYETAACLLGETLLTMQDKDGGIRDGDRAPEKIHTEPHADTAAAFLMLYQITGDEKWNIGAERAFDWFRRNVYYPEQGIIHQGVWSGVPSTIFATDCYSWTMAGPIGERIPPDILEKLTDTMLSRSLVKVTLSLPDSTTRTVILCDFSDAQDSLVKEVRGGFHPMGSVEWTGGVILALEKNAVRFWNAGERATARLYKALAEALLIETANCFYYLDELRGWVTFYASGQGLEVGPFGSITADFPSGWKTPFFYAKAKDNEVVIKGGSTIGAWVLMPRLGVNPFILDDNYKKIYDKIPFTQEDKETAGFFLEESTTMRTFYEVIPREIPDSDVQIIEPRVFNQKMWEAFERAYDAKKKGQKQTAERYFKEAIMWAEKIVTDSKWVELARYDNFRKTLWFGGIIAYPWGVTYPDNDHPLHAAIWKFPLLNEVATAMWGLATAYFELGNDLFAQYWIGRIIDDVPLHQIAEVKSQSNREASRIVCGYWNALVSWEDNPGGYERDEQMGVLYRQLLKERGLSTAKPKTVILPFN